MKQVRPSDFRPGGNFNLHVRLVNDDTLEFSHDLVMHSGMLNSTPIVFLNDDADWTFYVADPTEMDGFSIEISNRPYATASLQHYGLVNMIMVSTQRKTGYYHVKEAGDVQGRKLWRIVFSRVNLPARNGL